MDLVAIRRGGIWPERATCLFHLLTGVGKTELGQSAGSKLFDTTDPLIHLDMSEYMEKHSVPRSSVRPAMWAMMRLVSSPKVRRKPGGCVFDEMKRRTPDVLDILLQILDEGRILTRSRRPSSLENTVIVMTNSRNLTGIGRRRGSESGDECTRICLRPEVVWCSSTTTTPALPVCCWTRIKGPCGEGNPLWLRRGKGGPLIAVLWRPQRRPCHPRTSAGGGGAASPNCRGAPAILLPC